MIRDVATEDGTPVEITDDWYAQDKDGNVWYLGEAVRNFENGKFVDREGSFEAGVDGAEPGVVMPADPVPGLSYRQEYYKGEAEDKGEVITVGEERVEVPGRFLQGRSDDPRPRATRAKGPGAEVLRQGCGTGAEHAHRRCRRPRDADQLQEREVAPASDARQT